MEIKPSFSLILCCCLFSSFIFFPQGIVPRTLLEFQEGNNGRSKASVSASRTNTAPSQAGQNPFPVVPRQNTPTSPTSQSMVRVVVHSPPPPTSESWGEYSPPSPTAQSSIPVMYSPLTPTGESWEYSPPPPTSQSSEEVSSEDCNWTSSYSQANCDP
ncbi:pectinesterase inhibitor 10-like [Hibiscus syriacus]|uniref:pectinesterase inhibitor 10-like n=1 Tax=Hibiscus syriacus TaxID=106335 RepID=UPI001924A332|nr:pectinesterase inhibitor 10-like [Hibiscus syriacus]